MQISQLSVADAIASLHGSVHGLSSAEAARRLREYGPNRLEEIARESLFLRFLKELTRFFSVILWVAAALAFLAEWNEPGQGMARLGYAIITVILLINYTRWRNLLLGTAPLGADAWWFLLPFAVVMVLLEEVRKGIVRKEPGS